ncbi:MAG: hypothetical protein AMXMBFR31_18300 [Candidatus Desulfobacillus denitrificans]
MTDAMKARVEAEEAGPEMVDVIPEEQWLEQTITELHARPHLWPLLQEAMKRPNHRPNEELHLVKEAVQLMFDDLVATKKNRQGMTGADAMQTLANRFRVSVGKIKNIIHPPKSRKRTP